MKIDAPKANACSSWKNILYLKAPPGSKLKLDFYDFDIVANSDGTCEDSLEVRHSLPGQFGLR